MATADVSIGAQQMRAVMKSGPGRENVGLRAVARPTAVPGTAIVRVVATGVCGTDLHIVHDEFAYEAPVVMGHEILGEVVEVADATDSGWLGARVACETYYSTCQTCQWCRAGRPNLCRNRRSLGSFEDGGFAELVRVPVINLHRLPDVLGPLDGVLSEPLACVTQCLLDPPVVNAGDRVLVVGPGTMGQICAQVARVMGGNVTLAGLDRDAPRLAIAGSLGIATTTAQPESESFDVTIECSGSAAGAALALTAATRGGRYVQVGIFGRLVTVPMDLVLYKELTVTSGSASTPESWRRAMALLAGGHLQLAPLVTGQVEIADWQEAFAAAEAGDGIKTVILGDSRAAPTRPGGPRTR